MKLKGKIIFAVTIGLVCFLLIMIMFIQFKIVYQTDITSIDSMRQEELEEELASWKLKYDDVEEKYNQVTETLKKYKEESNSDSESKNNLKEELENLNLMLGLTDVEGEGIIITFNDSNNEAKKITADQLMIIVNYLKDAGAEAISINEQRIINTTDFVTITETFNKINGQRVSSPYIIKVIGAPDYLKGSLIGTGYTEKIKGWGQEISFEDKRKVEITKYDGNMTTKYIQE